MRRLRAPALVVVGWLLVDRLFTVVAGHQGLLAPFGPVHLAAASLGLAAISLRLVVTFLLLPWAAWRTLNTSSPAAASPPKRLVSQVLHP
jgi:hypothetical protein